MRAIGVIPARFSSTRFEGKVLAKIYDKPLIQYVYENARRAKLLDDLVVATDDQRVMEAVKEFGGKALLTAKEHKSGTDRLKEVVDPIDVKVVVNIQADEPLIHPTMIDDVVRALLDQPAIKIATILKKIEVGNEITDSNVVKVVFDKNAFALYFSRAPIPYKSNYELPSCAKAFPFARASEDKSEGRPVANYYKHIGLYAYSKDFLSAFTNLPVSILEEAERLEQLRALENGYRIKVIETNYETLAVDTPEDLETVKEKLAPPGCK